MLTYDFTRCFVVWDRIGAPRPERDGTDWGNRARLQVDAVLDIVDGRNTTVEQYVLSAPCRGEWMYGDADLFAFLEQPGLDPLEHRAGHNREYRVIWSASMHRPVSRGPLADEGGVLPRDSGAPRPNSAHYTTVEFQLAPFTRTRHLASTAEIIDATMAGLPLVGHTALALDQSDGSRAVVQYPIRTMNVHPPRQLFQVDTGPLLALDRTSTAPHRLERLCVAHLAYNRLDRAEFLIRRPVALRRDRRELVRIMEYADIHQWQAQSEIVAGESG